ncbi:MAG: RNA polymerase sigma factor [Asticcacaulis sp.]
MNTPPPSPPSPPSVSPGPLIHAYLEKRALLLRYVAGACRDPAMAEDIIQDLYVRLSGLKAEPAVDNPTAYLFRMANNIYLNRLRALKSERSRDHAWQQTSFETLGGDAVADEPGPEARIAGRQQVARLKAAIDALPERSREIFRLHKLDGLTQTQVASRLGLSISAVEKHLSAALKILTARLSDGQGP